MLRRVLIANRGEIALRILRACRQLGIETVAAYTRVDESLIHLDYADATVCTGAVSYLDADAMVAAARSRDCDSIHPGYGLLSENADFAEKVSAAGLKLVGPSVDVMRRMGDKASARQTAQQQGVNVVPGSGPLADAAEAASVAAEMGYPVLLKAVHGGGGRGMRKVTSPATLPAAFQDAAQESLVSFGQADLYLEKCLEKARHIEVQVLGDGRGNAVHVGTRECSVQRRHQKLIEEGPAVNLPQVLVDEMTTGAVALASALSYDGAGTVEYLVADNRAYFIEMNTRIQVEHGVSEQISGVDLVAAQLDIAGGGSLPQGIELRGHSVECRINAEAPGRQGEVTPSPGRIDGVRLPGGPGIRVDTQIHDGYVVPHQFDSLVLKLMAWGRDRNEAIRRLSGALCELRIGGIHTNRDRMLTMVSSEAFLMGKAHTRSVDEGEI